MIPRPSGATVGGPAPWAHLPDHERQATLSGIVDALSRREPQIIGSATRNVAQSAVLVLLYERSDDVYMVLTRRSPRLRHHAHEVAFPGGRHEAGDVDLWTTAVREAQEEVGIDPSTIRRIGELDSFATVGSKTMVTPFVATTDHQPTLKPDPIEVELIRHVSFGELLLDEVWREEFWPLPPRPSGPLDDFRSPIFAGSKAVARAAPPAARAARERTEQERMVEHTEQERMVERTEQERMVEHSERERAVEHSERERMVEHTERERMVEHTERERAVERSEREREEPRDGPRAITFFELVGDTVWGATGSMLRQLLAITTGVEDTTHNEGTAGAGVVGG